jgi:hypothetical protein
MYLNTFFKWGLILLRETTSTSLNRPDYGYFNIKIGGEKRWIVHFYTKEVMDKWVFSKEKLKWIITKQIKEIIEKQKAK